MAGSGDRERSVVSWIAFWIFLMALVIGVSFVKSKIDENSTRDERFEGACTVLNGHVYGDVCIKDNQVILWKKDFEKGK